MSSHLFTQQRQPKSLLPNDIYLKALQKIYELSNLNNKLIIIADQISKINHPDIHKPHPPIIYQFQTDINNSFNALIQNIQEYFIVLDQKLKQIGNFIQNRVNNGVTQRANSGSGSGNGSNFENLSHRIELLENNLKRTQANEAKLIKIVEELTTKQKEQQPTLIKNRQFECGMPDNHYSSHSQNSFRLFSVMDKKPQSLYPRPYVTSTTLKTSSQLQSSKHQRNDIMKMCMPTINDYTVKSIGVGKRSLKGQVQPEMQSSNKQHRMVYMMKVLKQ